MYITAANQPIGQLTQRLILTLPALLASMAISMPNAALPLFSEQFSVSFSFVQWLIQGYLLAITVLAVVVGRLGDVLGHRRLLLHGVLLFSIAALLAALSSSFMNLILFRVLQGIGAAIMLVISMAALSVYTPPEKTGKAMGMLASMSALGMAGGPVIGGVLAEFWGWPSLFLFMSFAGLLVSGSIFLGIRPAEHGAVAVFSWKMLDGAGFTTLLLCILCFSLGMTLAWDWLYTPLSFLLAILCGGYFYKVERTVKSPLLDMALLSNPAVAAGVTGNIAVMMVMMTTLLVGPFYLTYALGLSESLLGLVMTAGPTTVFISSFFAGYWIDRFGPERVRQVGQGFMVFGCVLLMLTDMNYGIPGYVLPLILITLGYSFFQTANNTESLLGVSVDQKGVLSGLLGLSRNLGLVIGASIMGAVFVWRSNTQWGGSTQIMATDVEQGLNEVFLFAALLLIGAFSIAHGLRKRWGVS